MPYVVTVNRDRIDKGEADPIRIEDTSSGLVTHASEVQLEGNVLVRHGDRRQDGATVWIEADAAWVIL